MTREQLVALRRATDDAIGAIEIEWLRRGAINWADLSCRQAAWVTTDEGESYAEVLIEEADPEASEFRAAVRAELVKTGWPDVRVVTEW